MSQPRAITIALFAMGGEGGGVLADWLVDLGEANGYLAQSTSVPGVAQRTGATVYYVELFPQSQVPPGSQPVLALAPVPGEVDIVLASELMEAARALQRGLVTPDRTLLVASTHRIYSMTERTALGDGRVDDDKILVGAKAGARSLVAHDFGALADEAGSPIGPALFGALAASGALPFSRDQCEAAIRRGGVGVGASLKAFEAAFALAQQAELPPSRPPVPRTLLGPRLQVQADRIAEHFPASTHATLRAGVLRLADYQDVAYADEYLARLMPLRSGPEHLLDETARHLALWMSYEDAVRVADLKTRRSRFQRVAEEVGLGAAQQLEIREFMHPRLEEIADTLPARLGRWLLATSWARGAVGRLTRRGRIVNTSSLRGYLLLYGIASLRPMRRGSLRYQTEQDRIAVWLDCIERLAPVRADLAVEVARAQRLVKGYGDTHARGWHNFQQLMAVVPSLRGAPYGGEQLRKLGEAALADDSGQTLETLLASVRIDAMQRGV